MLGIDVAHERLRGRAQCMSARPGCCDSRHALRRRCMVGTRPASEHGRAFPAPTLGRRGAAIWHRSASNARARSRACRPSRKPTGSAWAERSGVEQPRGRRWRWRPSLQRRPRAWRRPRRPFPCPRAAARSAGSARSLGEPGDRDRFGLGPDRGQPWPLRLRAAAGARVRLRRRERTVRLRLEPVAAGDHPEDRQGGAAVRDADTAESDVFVLSGAEDLVPELVRGRSPSWQRLTASPRTVGGRRVRGLAATARGPRGCSRGSSDGQRRPPATTHWRSITRDNVTHVYGARRRAPDRRPGTRAAARVQLADLRELRRPGQRDHLRVPAEDDGRRRSARTPTSATGTGAQPHRRTATSSAIRYGNRRLARRSRPPPRPARTGCSRSSSTTASTTPRRPDAAATHGAWASGQRPVLDLPGRLRDAHLPAAASGS